jgi:thioredoxin 1
MSVLRVTKDNFQQEVLNCEQPVLVDFWAEWCGPCKMMAPVMDELSADNDNVKVVKINTDESPDLAREFGIMSIPTILLFKNGQVQATSTGFVPKEQIERLLK